MRVAADRAGAGAAENTKWRERALLEWYAATARDLPWRRSRDPYAVLVSEVMLQQTQVDRVAPRFEAWLERWPTADALASAPAAEVLAAWSGLGYNSRALRLQRAARQVVRDGWPKDERGLRALPGVGPYTAAAVAAFAFGLRAAAVDTNQQRVLDRWDGAVGRSVAELRARALELVPAQAPAEWNHALMDLGATLCMARRARCDRCPVAAWCASAGTVDLAAERELRGPAAPSPRFEETQRYVRGRIVATLVATGPLPKAALAEALPNQIAAARVERALATLQRDGLVVVRDGMVALPGAEA
ncbi:MAG: A/G-specific adenine glycosylase [Patulibacter sp.]